MQGKTVVITGGTSGIGQIAAEKLAAMGARMVLVARDPKRGEATMAKLRQLGPGNHSIHYADLSRLSEMKRVAEEIAAGSLGNEMRQAPLEHVLAPAFDVVAMQGLDVERAEAALDVVCIDRQHGRHVFVGRGSDHYVGRHFRHYSLTT